MIFRKMMRAFRYRYWLLGSVFALAIFTSVAEAQTRYVSDELVITFRTGPGSQYSITRNLTSGARVQLLEERADEGYSRVRLADGSEGWVLTRYLQDGPTARLQLDAAVRERDAATQKADDLEQRVTDLEQQLSEKTEALTESESGAKSLNAELADIRSASANAIETRDENEQLKKRLAALTSEAQVTEMEIDELRRRERQNWFVVGAVVLFGGIVIGLVAPRLRPRRRSSW